MSDPSAESARRLAAIMFTDIVGYTRAMAESEATGRRLRERHAALVRPLVRRYHGEWIEERGDESLSSFASAVEGVNCALAIQRELEGDAELRLRIGIHLADVSFEGGGILGDGVNLAARILPLAEPGGICISDEVQHSIQNQENVRTRSLGEQSLKNVPRPVHVFAVTGQASPPRTAAAAPRASVRRAPWAGLLTAVVLLAGLAVWWTSRAPTPIRSIAVLPFVDMSAARDQEYFADGMSEELINALSKLPGLRVAARTSAFAFKDRSEDVRSIGRQLNVRALVEGSVRRAHGRVRITAQLVRVSDGFHIWSDSYDHELGDVFAIQDEIARSVAAALEVHLSPQSPLVRRPTGDLRAYEQYLMGRHFWSRRTREGLRKAIEHFDAALRVDPGYALAYVGLADAYTMLWSYGFERTEEVFSRAARAGDRALAIDDGIGEAHASRGFRLMLERDWGGAERALQRALQLSPGYPFAHDWYGDLLMILGRSDEAQHHYRRALELDPLSVVINRDLGRFHLYTGDYGAAEERLRRALELQPDDPVSRADLARSLVARGRHEAALDEILRLVPPELVGEVRAAYGVSGFPAAVRRMVDLQVAREGRRCPGRSWDAAVDLAYLGEREWMFECLEEWVRQGGLLMVLRHPWIREYRTDPRFAAISREVGLEP